MDHQSVVQEGSKYPGENNAVMGGFRSTFGL